MKIFKQNMTTNSNNNNIVIFICFLLMLFMTFTCNTVLATQHELLVGFETRPDTSSGSLFHPVLVDPTGNFSLGFLRVDDTQPPSLSLSVVHVPSLQPLWQASTTPTASLLTYRSAVLTFNGSLVITDTKTRAFWSSEKQGAKVVLLNSSNLQIQEAGSGGSPLVTWQSFDFPTNTLVEMQNFTSAMELVSSNGAYSLRLGADYMALFANFNKDDNTQQQTYWKHKALEAKADVIEGQGPIYARVEPDGFFGMYQVGPKPVDVQAFTTFQRPMNGFLIVRLEPDGNLKAYYWNGTEWLLDYQAIPTSCDLPSPCGSFGLCGPGGRCSCLDNRTEPQSKQCLTGQDGDFCGGGETENTFWVLRRNGVDLPFKELMSNEMASSLDQCEGYCANNCTCWGAVFSNMTGYCYLIDYPIQTLLSVGDESKMGYFKVKESTTRSRISPSFDVAIGVLCGSMLVLIGGVGFCGYRTWKRRRGIRRILEEEAGGPMSGPYKDIGSASFRSIELSTADSNNHE